MGLPYPGTIYSNLLVFQSVNVDGSSSGYTMCLVEIETFKVLATFLYCYPLKASWYRVNLIRWNYMFWSIISSKTKIVKLDKRLWASQSKESNIYDLVVLNKLEVKLRSSTYYLSYDLMTPKLKLVCVTLYWKWKQICLITYKVDIILMTLLFDVKLQSLQFIDNATECSVKSINFTFLSR